MKGKSKCMIESYKHISEEQKEIYYASGENIDNVFKSEKIFAFTLL